MRNNVYYIKPQNNNFSEAIKIGFAKALSLVEKKGFSNVKLVLSSLGLLNNPPNFISDAFDELFQNKGIELVKKLKNNRGFSIQDFPEKGKTTGVNLLLSNKEQFFKEEETVVVLIWASFDSFNKIQSSLFLVKNRFNFDCV